MSCCDCVACSRTSFALPRASLVGLFLFLLGGFGAMLPTVAHPAEAISFSREIRPILSEYCFSCHGPDEQGREAGLRLDLESSAKGGEGSPLAIVAGKPEASELIRRIESQDADEQMPPPKLHKKIPPEQVARLKAWIQQGATWGNHWSYEPVRRPEVPADGQTTAIDAFLGERLAREGLDFSPAADRRTLIRRVALDTTGLPPTLEEYEQLAEGSHEEIVAHYLAKPSYGEHWAREWLDLARYADSAGYPSDPGREIWAYRDWVIQALNRNMPFDQFTIEQIAGDLYPQPTEDQLIATAFHRNTMTQNEGGTNDEEFRTAAVIDRVNTTYAVWMGTTMACAQCHSHKYDPISQREYFESYAFFNQSADADRKDESPLHEMIDAATREKRDSWRKEVEALEAQFNAPPAGWLEGLDAWLQSSPTIQGDRRLKEALAAAPETRTKQQLRLIEQHYVRNISLATKEERQQLAKLRKELEGSKPVTVPIMQELDSQQRRKTFIQLRGNWQALGDEVQEGVPVALHRLPQDAPRNRMGFACWLVSGENPLTARVAVNRMWESLFGVGIVRSSEEFGSQGDMPVHPELLDWLAAEFIESGWDVKHMLRLMLNSRAYCQVSTVTARLQERDPDNRWLARGPRFRPSGELLRDQALAVSGLLSPKMFGPPVRPVRPNLGLGVAFGGKGGKDWEASSGEDRYRRSVYTEVRRNSPYPSFTTFDAPNREVCTIRRGRSNTPLQAFVTLNDPVFIECHQALARRMVAVGGDDCQAALRFAYQVCLGREPSTADLETLLQVYEETRRQYAEHPDLALKMATEPLGPLADGSDVVALAAWTNVAGVLMNLDEFLMRP
jgi:hypothetical protein